MVVQQKTERKSNFDGPWPQLSVQCREHAELIKQTIVSSPPGQRPMGQNGVQINREKSQTVNQCYFGGTGANNSPALE